MISLIAQSLVLTGALILMGALIPMRRLTNRLPSGSVRNRWYAMTALIILFFISYLGYAMAFWNKHSNLLDLIVPGVFFSGACFVWLTATLSLQTAIDLMRINLLEREVNTDALTGTFNRRYLNRRLNEEVARVRRYDLPFSILLLDIDHFKRVNDKYGHQVGDQVLISLAEVVASVIRNTDILCRYGGEEFLVMAPHTALLGAGDLAERLRQRIESHNFNLSSEAGGTYGNNVTISIGVASIDDSVNSVETLVQIADKNLYHAKQQGRNRVHTGGFARVELSSTTKPGN